MWFKKPSDMWATATGEESGFPLIYRYREHRPRRSKPDSLPSALRVVWRYDGSTNNGMPLPNDNEAQVRFEDAIEKLTEEPDSFLMLVLTGNSRKEWLFYTRTTDEWAAALTRRLAKHPPYPLEISGWPDASWSTWQNFASSVSGES